MIHVLYSPQHDPLSAASKLRTQLVDFGGLRLISTHSSSLNPGFLQTVDSPDAREHAGNIRLSGAGQAAIREHGATAEGGPLLQSSCTAISNNRRGFNSLRYVIFKVYHTCRSCPSYTAFDYRACEEV